MSAIWGVIDLKQRSIPLGLQEKFEASYSKCVIDKTSCITENSYILGCGLQIFTPEAKLEKLPISYENNSILFTADVFLDNRDELINELSIQPEKAVTIPDGDLLFMFYNKYGKSCLNKIRGTYTFVYYNHKQSYIDIVCDALGNHCLYYTYRDGILYFSSLLKPFESILPEKPTLNDEFFANYLAINDYRLFSKCEDTKYCNIFRTAPAQYIHIWLDNMTKEIYWQPLKHIKKIKCKNDEEYKKKFIDLFTDSVNCVLRSVDKTGILLSGGLDSTSVACFAAPILQKENKNLYSYTMIPEVGYKPDPNSKRIEDESTTVKYIKEFLPNLIDQYNNFHDKNLWNVRDEALEIYEMPYKSLQNPMHILDILRQSYRDGCRLILNGQQGNNSISYGDIKAYYYELFKYFHWIKLYKEMYTGMKKYKYSRKLIIKSLLRTAINKHEKKATEKDLFSAALIEPSYINKYKINSEQLQYHEMVRHIKTKKGYHFFMTNPIYLRQIGEYDTKHSLYTGVMIKDPTRDKRLVEFCLALPVEQFNKDCIPRRLIYVYLKDYLPKQILDMSIYRGLQAADTFYRINNFIPEIYSFIRKQFLTPSCTLIDIEVLLKQLNENENLYLLGEINKNAWTYQFERIIFASLVEQIYNQNN